MATTGSPPSASLTLILSTWLVTDTIAINSADSIFTILNQFQIIRQLSLQDNDDHASAVLNRWHLRISSLLGSRSPPVCQLGARLAISTLEQSETTLLSHGSGWLTTALTILTRSAAENGSSISVSPAISLALYIFEKGSQWPDFARENCDPKALLGLTRSLIALSGDEITDVEIRSGALQALSTLLPRYSTTLRPVATQLQTLALSQLLHPSEMVSSHATSLLISLYRLSGKVDATVAWSTTITGTIGTIDTVLDTLISPIWKESLIFPEASQSDNQRLASLDIPLQSLMSSTDSVDVERDQLPINQILLLLKRIESFVKILVVMLSEPTERPVHIPIGELCRLAWRMLSIEKAELKPRPDLSWKSAWDCVGTTISLRAMGCRLIAQTATTTSTAFIPFATPSLLIIVAALESGMAVKTRSMDTSVLYTTFAKIASSCSQNPDTLKWTLEPILKAILHDIKSICGRRSQLSRHTNSDGMKNQKSASKKKKYENDQVWTRSTVVDQIDLIHGQRSLNALEALLSSVPHFFPSPYLTVLVQHLLSLASHPSFFSPLSSISTTASTTLANLSTSSTPSPALAFALRPGLRPSILRCLISCIPIQKTSAQSTMGLNLSESLIEILSQLLVGTDNAEGEVIDLARVGLREIGLMIRPRVPPISLTQAQSRVEEDAELDHDDEGGSQDDDMEVEQLRSSTVTAQGPLLPSIARAADQSAVHPTPPSYSNGIMASTTPAVSNAATLTSSSVLQAFHHPVERPIQKLVTDTTTQPASQESENVPSIEPLVPIRTAMSKEEPTTSKRKSDETGLSFNGQQKQKQPRRDERGTESDDSDGSEIPQLNFEESDDES